MSTETVEDTTFRTFALPLPGRVRPDVFVPREQLPKALLAAEATTYGWDTVNCIKLPLVNQVLATSDRYPHELHMTLNEKEHWAIATSYGPWQVAAGGSGSILMMKLPLTQATMTYGSNRIAVANGYALISIKLRYLPQTPTSAATQDNPIDIEQLIADAEARSADDPAVVVQRVNYGSGTPTEEEKALFVASLALLLNANLGAFTHIFAVVNLNQRAAQKEFVWLKPTFTSYAYFQGLDDDNSYFAILNQTEGRTPEGLTNQVSASAIPSAMNASVLISSTLFIRQFVFPGLTRAFTHAATDAFTITGLGQAIENVRQVRLDDVRVGAVNYTPYMNAFRLQIVGEEIQMTTKVSINISPGIDAYVDATYFYTVGLARRKDGSLTLDFEPAGDPIITSWYTVAFWVTLTQLLVSIIGAVIGAVVAEAIENVVMKVVVVALITIVAGVAAAIPTLIAQVITEGAASALPPIGPMIDEASAPVEWPSSSGFTVQSAELNGAFQLGGMLAITVA